MDPIFSSCDIPHVVDIIDDARIVAKVATQRSPGPKPVGNIAAQLDGQINGHCADSYTRRQKTEPDDGPHKQQDEVLHFPRPFSILAISSLSPSTSRRSQAVLRR